MHDVQRASLCACLEDERTSCWAKWHARKCLDVNYAEKTISNKDQASKRKRAAPSSESRIPPVTLRKETKVREISDNTRSSDVLSFPNEEHEAPESNPPGFLKCASVCGRDSLLVQADSAHVCNVCSLLIHVFCVYSHWGEFSRDRYYGYKAGGYCKACIYF